MARGDFPSAKQDQYVLRFPGGMRDRIKTTAEANGRSMNAEIVERLEDSFTFPGREARLNAKIAEQGREAEGLYQEIDEMQNEIKRREQSQIEHLAEIRRLRIDRQDFDSALDGKQSEIDALREELGEVRQILRNYVAHSEHLHRLEDHLRQLIDRLPAISMDDALRQMQGNAEKDDHE